MTSNNSVWNQSSTLVERIKANEETFKKLEEEAMAKKEAMVKKEKETLDKEREIARYRAMVQLRVREEKEERASYRTRIPYGWRGLWDYCYERSHGKMYQDFIIAAFKSNKLNLIDSSVILMGSAAVEEEAIKHNIYY
jgi:hypothetical protein